MEKQRLNDSITKEGTSHIGFHIHSFPWGEPL